METRNQVLGRIREALQVLAPIPGHHGVAAQIDQMPSPDKFQAWLPEVGSTCEARIALFAKQSAELKTEFQVVKGRSEVEGWIQEHQSEWKNAAIHRGALLDSVRGAFSIPLLDVAGGYPVDKLKSCDVGFTECEALVAQTGSVVVSSRTCGGRGISVLPPHHVVVAKMSQLVADLPEAFHQLKVRYEGNYPSMISFITGPSRTGDIERILVLGAHGPKRVTVLLMED